MDTTKELTHISLCAGYGGIDIGLKRAVGNVRTIAFSEIEAYAVANLVAKMEKGWLDAAPIWSNLKTFPWEEFYKKVDILSGGFPCQPFSTAGRNKADEDSRHLWPYIVKGIKELGRPPIVFFENVEGIISSRLKSDDWSDPRETSVLQHVLRELERLGYKTTAGVFSASEVGAPHQRKRVFIIGIQDGVSDILQKNKKTKRTAYPFYRSRHQCEWEAPRTLPILGNSNLKHVQDSFNEKKSNIKKIKRRKTRLHFNANIKNELGNSNKPRLQRTLFFKKSIHKKKKFITRSSSPRNISRIFKSSLGRATYGVARWMDSSKCKTNFDNRTDELRLLGNGVVPDTATRAFRILFKELANSHK